MSDQFDQHEVQNLEPPEERQLESSDEVPIQKDQREEGDEQADVAQSPKQKEVRDNFQIESSEDEESDAAASNGAVKGAIAGVVAGKIAQKAEEIVKQAVTQINKAETKRIISQAALERKTEAFEQSKQWEQLRAMQVQGHRQILESVWGRIQKIVGSSDDSMKFLVSFLKNRIEQEESQLKFLQTASLGKLFKEFDGKIVQSNYPEFSKAIRVVDSATERQCDQLRIFIAWLSNQIRERLELEMANFEKQNKEFCSYFSRQKKVLQELEKDVQKYFTKYERLYLNMTTKQKKYLKDFLNAELKFKNAANRHILAQREFGNWLLGAWNDIQTLEAQRLELCTQTIIDFLGQVLNSYGKTQQYDSTVAALNGFKPKTEVQSLYSQTYILNKQEIEFIQNEQLQEVTKYFNNFQVQDKFAELAHPLILKVFNAQRDVGTIGKTWQDCGVIITVDHYFLIFSGKPTRYSRAEAKYPLEGLKIKKTANFEVEITFIIPGLVMDSKKKMLMQFSKADELEELSYYLETVGQNKFALD